MLDIFVICASAKLVQRILSNWQFDLFISLIALLPKPRRSHRYAVASQTHRWHRYQAIDSPKFKQCCTRRIYRVWLWIKTRKAGKGSKRRSGFWRVFRRKPELSGGCFHYGSIIEYCVFREISAAGRMQALCDSVLIIDEVQSLPKKWQWWLIWQWIFCSNIARQRLSSLRQHNHALKN